MVRNLVGGGVGILGRKMHALQVHQRKVLFTKE